MDSMKKTFDAVAFMRKPREEFSHAYAGLSWQQIEERTQQALKADPLWRQGPRAHRRARRVPDTFAFQQNMKYVGLALS